MRTPKQSKSRLRAAFVLTASFGASITGCDGSLTSGEDGGGGGAAGGGTANPSGCPPKEPSYNDPCFTGTECEYEDLCGEPVLATCVDGGWETYSDVCNPPAPCPEEDPVEGEHCTDEGGFGGPYGCELTVDTPCGAQAIVANCYFHPQLGDVWVFEVDESCTSTAADCPTYVSETLCGADTACRWLAPACGDPDKLVPGACYPIADCAADTCGPTEVCTPVTYDPCWGLEKCETGCSADASLCLPSP